MKKLVLVSAFFALATTAAMSQCVPTEGLTGKGFAFATTELDPVYACATCEDLERVISFKTFTDTTLSIVIQENPPLDVTVYADRFRVDSIAGLPVGVTYTANSKFDTTYDAVENPQGYWINAGDTISGFTDTIGCITLSGSAAAWTAAADGGPNNDGVYPLVVYLDVRAADFDPPAIANFVGYNVWLSEMGAILPAFGDPNFTTNGIAYQAPALKVYSSGLGIENAAKEAFGKVMNSPNPFTGNTTITFDVYGPASDMQFTVYNMLGAVVHSRVLNPTMGTNRVLFAADQLPSGVYVYTLTDGNVVQTRKMSVQ